jgi:hypothetical protein
MTTDGALASELLLCTDNIPRTHWRIAPQTTTSRE